MSNESQLRAVKRAYFENREDNDFDGIINCITELFYKEESYEKLRRVIITNDALFSIFNILPAEITGEIIKWGTNDTCVRDEIYIFMKEKKEIIKKILKI